MDRREQRRVRRRGQRQPRDRTRSVAGPTPPRRCAPIALEAPTSGTATAPAPGGCPNGRPRSPPPVTATSRSSKMPAARHSATSKPALVEEPSHHPTGLGEHPSVQVPAPPQQLGDGVELVLMGRRFVRQPLPNRRHLVRESLVADGEGHLALADDRCRRRRRRMAVVGQVAQPRRDGAGEPTLLGESPARSTVPTTTGGNRKSPPSIANPPAVRAHRVERRLAAPHAGLGDDGQPPDAALRDRRRRRRRAAPGSPRRSTSAAPRHRRRRHRRRLPHRPTTTAPTLVQPVGEHRPQVDEPPLDEVVGERATEPLATLVGPVGVHEVGDHRRRHAVVRTRVSARPPARPVTRWRPMSGRPRHDHVPDAVEAATPAGPASCANSAVVIVCRRGVRWPASPDRSRPSAPEGSRPTPTSQSRTPP